MQIRSIHIVILLTFVGASVFAQSGTAAPPRQFMEKPAKKSKPVNLSESRKVIKEFVDLLSKGKAEKSYAQLHPRTQKKRPLQDWEKYVRDFRKEAAKNNGISDVSVEAERRQVHTEDYLFMVYKVIYTNGAFRQERCMLFRIDDTWKIDM